MATSVITEMPAPVAQYAGEGCDAAIFFRTRDGLSPELQRALEPLLAGIEGLSEQILEYNQRIEARAQTSYPQVVLLKQIKGVGTLIALTFLLTLEDPHPFRKSRDVGCYLGLQPGRRNSGQSEPQMHISKEGDPYLRTLLVQGAQHILRPFGVDCDLRRWGLKLAERGGRNGKKRAIIATARKLAVLLHHLWVSGEVYEPLRNSNRGALPAREGNESYPLRMPKRTDTRTDTNRRSTSEKANHSGICSWTLGRLSVLICRGGVARGPTRIQTSHFTVISAILSAEISSSRRAFSPTQRGVK